MYNRFVCALTLGFGIGQAFSQEDPSASLFGLDNVVDIHITIKGEEFDKLKPPADVRLDGQAVGQAFEDLIADASRGGHFLSEKSTRPGLAGYLGVDHQYGRADVEIDGETVKDVGLRYKGNGTFIEGDRVDRYSFKIDFNEYVEGQEFRGITKINLNNNITDPSLMREALSYDLFRDAKIPASRVGYARVYLTIPDETKREIKREPIGLFTLVEQKDKRFLKRNYGSSKGLLMKPSTFGLFRYLGEEWAEYQIGFVPKTKPTEEQKKRVIEFARLIHKSDFDEFEKRYDEYLDVDQYLRFLACNVIACNLDSFLGGSQNHYIYLEPKSNKFQFLPWDMDHSFGAFHLMGEPNARRRLSIDRPVTDNRPIIDRVLQVRGNKEKYHAYIEEYINTIFDQAVMLKKIESIGEFVRPMVNLNGDDAESRFDKVLADEPSMFEQHPLKYFVKVRHESIRAQLDGASLGQSVGFGGFPDLGPYIPWIISALVLVFLQSIGWIWGIVVGFRGSTLWGCLNIFFSPWTPAVYGFAIRRDLGFRCALYSMFCIAGWVVWIFLLFFHKSIFGE